MAEEYNCHQGNMTVTELAANGYRVTGCGSTATYDCSVGANGTMTCVKEAGSSPVPEVPAHPADAGPSGRAPQGLERSPNA
jgi:hypothetical protein